MQLLKSLAARIQGLFALKLLFWVLALFALAVGLVVAARYNAGYVLVVFPSRRVELSLNFAMVLLVGTVVVAYYLVRGVSALLRLPVEVRRFHEERRAQNARTAFMDAAQAYLEGRYGRAEKAAARALRLGYSPSLSAVLAARAAHEIRAFDARDRYLSAVENFGDDGDYLRRVTHAELLLDERRYLDALGVLAGIGERHTAALRLELKAHQMARNWDRVETLLPVLDKRRVYDPVVLTQLRRTATAELLRHKAAELAQLTDAWQKVPDDLRVDEFVARAAAQGFVRLGAGTTAGRILEAALQHQWDSQLVLLYAEVAGDDPVARIEKAEAWLPAHARDGVLLLALGRLCMQATLWGKARSYLEASLAVEPSHTAHLELARLSEDAGDTEEAGRHRRAALDLVLAQLGEATGGRRRRAV